MDDTPNTHPIRLDREPPRLPWRKLAAVTAAVTAISFAAGYTAAAIADWMGWAV